MSSAIRVAVVDDQALVRDGLVTVLSLADGLEVVGEAADGSAGVDLVLETSPDVVLLDLRMPVLDGVESCRRILAHRPGTAVVVLTTHADDASIRGALDAGATGYLTKDADRGELVGAVRAAAQGHRPLDARVTGRVLAGLPDADPADDLARLRARFPELSPREIEVFAHVLAGRTNAEIAATLVVGLATVKSHVHAVLTKLGARDRAQAIALAASR